ncbi:MAG: glycosyltransferase [Chitinophagaceae bacterium]|nr:glycosyltransferase [Chitinophagaceae bacterium]
MKILLVTTTQFGYLVDYYRYYGYLKKRGYDVRYICIDYGHEKIENGNPDIHYISGQGNKLLRHFKFINGIKKLEEEYKFDRIMLHVFPMISLLLTMIPRRKMYLDIRTVSIHTKFYKRFFFDSLIRIASLLFNHTSAITDIAAQQIGIRKYKLLPVGGAYFINNDNDDDFDNEEYRDIFSGNDDVFIYVGTLNKRGIIDCVKGFHSFKKKNPSARIRFVVIGTSPGGELKEINDYIEKHRLHSLIHTLGYIPQSRLSYFFNNAHCGVSYMPLSMPFSKQPNTKTYEYLVNGLPVVAIASPDNLQMIGNSKVPCGVIIEDSAEGMEQGIGKFLESKHLYNRVDIASEFGKYEWDNIFNIYLDDALSLSAS